MFYNTKVMSARVKLYPIEREARYTSNVETILLFGYIFYLVILHACYT